LGKLGYVGKTLFAQVMEFVPWTSFARIVQRHGGNAGVRSLSRAEQFRAMAFAQLTWRESLRDIEASLSANSTKLYTLLDLRGAIPAFIHISDGKMGDVNVLDMLSFEAGAFYVMDRGYLDFTRLHRLHQAGAFFVTRAKRGMDARRVYSNPVDRNTGLNCDQLVTLKAITPSTCGA